MAELDDVTRVVDLAHDLSKNDTDEEKLAFYVELSEHFLQLERDIAGVDVNDLIQE